MNSKKRLSRSIPFAPEQLKFLGRWLSDERKTTVARCLGVSERSIDKYMADGRVDKSKSDFFFKQLHQRMAMTAMAEPVDPATDIDRLLQSAQRLHFSRFRSLDALAPLEQIIHHPHWIQIPADKLFKCYVGVLAIFRQSMYVGEGHFLALSQRCLDRLSMLRPSDKGEELGAMVCSVAWELVAVNAQRGHATVCSPLLAEIEQILTDRLWDDLLPDGRKSSIIRLRHWSQVVAREDFGEVKKLLKCQRNPIAQIEALKMHHSSDTSNILLQLFVQHLRFPLHTPGEGTDAALEFFHTRFSCAYGPLVNQIIDKCVSTIGEIATPTTALAAALHSAVLASLIEVKESSDILERARHLYEWVNDTSCGSVMLQRANPQTMNFLRTSSGKRIRAALPELTFVADFSPRGCHVLLERARRLLSLLDSCSQRVVAASAHPR